MIGIPQLFEGRPLVHSWQYLDTQGNHLGIVGRYEIPGEKKKIVPFFNHNGSEWEAGIEITPRPLFGLDKLCSQEKDRIVVVVEGEKAAAALHSIGVCAITSIGGSKAAKSSDWTVFNGYKTVYILPDCDKSGEEYAQDVYTLLSNLQLPPEIKVVRLPNLKEHGDVVDWLQTLAPDWDGLKQAFPTSKRKLARSALATQLKEANLANEVWSSVSAQEKNHFDFNWDKPNEIVSKIPAVKTLEATLLPEPLKPWLMDVSYRMQTPPDFVSVTAIVIISSIIGAGCSIRPKRFDDWDVVPNLWGTCIGRPSVVLKSPSMKEPLQLLERLQKKYGELHANAKNEANFEIMLNKAMQDDIKSQIAKAAKGVGKDRVVNPDDLEKLKADYLECTQRLVEEPTRRLFKTNETSIQSMTVLQNQNPNGLLFFRDEVTGLLENWEKEDYADERAYFLEGWNGNSSYTDFKITRGLTDAQEICIALLGGIQPDKFKRYLRRASNGNNDGLIQRLQLAVWPDEPDNWQLVDIKPNKAAKQRAYDIMEKLAEMDFTMFGAEIDEPGSRPYFRFSETAQTVFNEWLTDLQLSKLKNEESPLMVEHFGKFRSLMPSLALIFHCIDIVDGNGEIAISEKSAKLAVKWCNYLESHARRIYAIADNQEYEATVSLSKKIKDGKLCTPFTSKTVYDKGWHNLKDKDIVESACNMLIDENWLIKINKPRPLTGRPPLPEYHINPDCMKKAN